MDYSKLKLASDIEAIGFYDVVNTVDDVHCLCSIDILNDKVYLFHNHPEFDNTRVVDPYDNKEYVIPARSGSLDDGIKFWEDVGLAGGKLIIHNARTYDQPVINKVWKDNKIPYEAYHDTFNQSKVQWFERPTPKGAKSPHGLKAYGILSGVNKPEVTDWSFIDAFKLHRCIEDCKIQAYTYDYLEKERMFFKTSFGADFATALRIEDMYATECFKQEVVGALVDVPHIKKCIEDLDNKIEELRKEIEPQLPPTLRGKGTKVSRSEMAELFGFSSSKIKDEVVKKKKDGAIVESVVKPYFKPCMKFTCSKKVTKYQGYHLEYGFSEIFDKKTEFAKWRNNNHPDTKPKEWLVEKIEDVTEEIDKNNCTFFDIKPEDTDYLCGPHTKITIEPSTMTQDEIVKGLLITLGWRYADEWNLKKDVYGNFIKVEEKTTVYWPEGAPEGKRLTKVIPKGGYLVSSPKLGEEDYKQLPEGLGQKIAHYNTYVHRRRFLENPKDPENKGLLSYVREDGRIPCGVNNFGTRSGRSSHRVWVNAPGDGALYGEEIRKCVIAPKGRVLVGNDQKSAQLSIAAYYANNQEYYTSVASGKEMEEDGSYVGMSAHCVNARMFGMVSEEDFKRAVLTQDPALIHEISLKRKKSKGGSFAVIFGASGKKVATTIGIPENEGHARKEQFLTQMGLDTVIDTLGSYEKKYPHKRGFMIPLAFGYWLWNNSSHKSVNTVVQGFEALAHKLATIRASKELERRGLSSSSKIIMSVHDELLIETVPQHAEEIGILVGASFTWAATQIFEYHLKNPAQFPNKGGPQFSIDLDGGYVVADNYYEVH